MWRRDGLVSGDKKFDESHFGQSRGPWPRPGGAVVGVVGNGGCGKVTGCGRLSKPWEQMQLRHLQALQVESKERCHGAMVVRMLVSCQRLGINKTSLKRCG